MVKATDIKKGMIIRNEGQLYLVIDYEHITPGNWRAIHQVKMKNLKTGNQLNLRLGTSDTLEDVFLEKAECQYLYKEGQSGCVFMNNENYEQFTLSADVAGDAMRFIVENGNVQVTFLEGQPISVELPSSVVLKVVEAEDAVKGNSVTNLQKIAKLETGYTLKVPLHIKVGDFVKVATETGEFLGRTKE